MFCFLISLGTFICGIFYLVMGYEPLVGWLQVVLGLLCVFLSLLWKWHATKDKKAGTDEWNQGKNTNASPAKNIDHPAS